MIKQQIPELQIFDFIVFWFTFTYQSNTMKPVFLIISILLSFVHVNAQLKVDAGNDIVLCFSDLSSSTTQLGGNPTASGGVEPYTYTWSGKILQHFGPKDSTWVYASYFLDDTTKSHPTFKRGKILFDWPTFKLEVKDAAGNVQHDSVKVFDGSIFILNSYMTPITIKKGDSVQFYGDRYFYDNCNFLPLKLSFCPVNGLSDPTDLHCWAKPDTSTTYYLQAINTAGCVAKTYYWRINVDPITFTRNTVLDQSTQCYLNHGDLIVNLPQKQDEPYQLTIATANGAIIHTGKYTNRKLRLSKIDLKESQLYIVSIIDGNEKTVFKLIGN
jgi:hypothetical protein